jgi:nucleoside-diphosphate-sugar epimerase
MTDLELEDIKNVAELPYNWDKLSNKTILISGGTGFIGSFFCNVIRYRNEHYHQGIKVISIAFNQLEDDNTVTYLKRDICEKVNIEGPVDYILHMASNTHPEQYKTDPVGTITGNVFGAYNLLTLAKEKHSIRFVLASSCEIYGDGKDEPMDELYCGYINSNTARAGYNEAKRVSESLCQSFAQQYGIESCVFRLARVFGADKTKKDTKAMAQFIRDAVEGRDIVLKSRGLQKYSYVYIADAVAGILKVLLDGTSGEAYNISADYDGMTLGQYAEYIASLSNNRVVYDISNNPNASQAQNALLDNSKIKKIGYKPRYSVCEALKRTYTIYKNNKEREI